METPYTPTGEPTWVSGWEAEKEVNINMWIGNYEEFYRAALKSKKGTSYRDFITNNVEILSTHTPDGVFWLDESLDYEWLDEMLLELHE